MPVANRLFSLLLALPLAACVALAQTDEERGAHEELPAVAEAAAAEPSTARLPEQELTEPLLYELLLAEIALQRGDAALAAQTYAELAKSTRDPRVARRAVEVANVARTPQFALEAAQVWHEADADSAQALQTLTVLLVNARRVDDAQPYLAKLLDRDGDAAANGFLQLGRLLAGNPDKRANLRVVRALAARHPGLAQAQLAIAQAALAANDDAAALEAARRAAQMRPGWDAAAVYEAQILQRQSPELAARSLAAFLETYPAARDARLAYARLLVGERRYAEARAQFEKLLAAHPDNGDVRYAVGLLALQLKDYATAETSLKRLLDMGFRDPHGVRFTLGQAAEEQKKWQEAIQWFESIPRGEHYLQARLRAANVMGKQGKLDAARAYLRALEAEGEQRVPVLIAEAQLLRDANQHRDAFDLLGKALQAQPEQPELLYDHALTAEKLERFDVLESSLRTLIRLKPDYAHAYNALGYSYADRNLRLPEARKLIERALELSPEDFYIIDSMGWVLYRMGDLKGAEEHLRRAYLGRPDAEIGAHLGEVLWKMGERAEAERVWQEVQKSHPENETLHKTLKRLRP
ncbi:MAG: tetratricopeptide repeat protein [Betaproteobacteria bacterium]|nr:tetratricopeptide repeat protein [Betaproteobacteria bacterium]